MEGSYSGAWRRYRVWSWAFWLAFLLYLPGMAFLSQALGWTRDGGDAIFVGRSSALLSRLRRAPLAPGLAAQPLRPRCLHCGLPKWAAAG